MIGRTLSHYEIAEEISRGGMGIVYRAVDTRLNREVAVKVLQPELVADPERKRRFVQEAKAAAALEHAHIAVIHEIDEVEGTIFIVMELIRGEKLSELEKRERLPLSKALGLGIEVGEGLIRAHDKGIVHRDLKPGNVMITEDGHAKIIDFGLAKLLERLPQEGSDIETAFQKTRDGVVLGTVPYMSPEQARGEEVDPRSDLFSFGILLYEMVSGQHPFRGASGIDTFTAILRDSAPPLPDLGSSVPRATVKWLERVLSRCMEKKPGERYQQSRELVAELRRLRASLDSGSVLLEPTPARSSPSIAVLPFSDMSPQKDQDWFCQGMAEEIINALTKVEGLRVASRTSAFQFRGQSEDIRRIGQALNVNAVLEGSVRTARNRLRITAQLVKVDDGYHVWSERYDREMEDVFDIQDEIAREIVNKLKVELIGDAKRATVKRPTDDVEAYNLFLKGRYYWGKRTEDSLKKGIEFFEQAIEKDPGYSWAYVGIADCFNQLADYGFIAASEAHEGAKAAATKAIELDDDLAEAHASLAMCLLLYDWDLEAAEREFQRAVELNPSYATAHQLYAECLTAMGRYDDAIAHVERAQELEPLSVIIATVVAWVYYRARRLDEAVAQCRKALELDANFAVAHHLLGWIYDAMGRFNEAIAEAEKSVELSGRGPLMVASLGYAFALSGNASRARDCLEELKERATRDYVPAYALALIHTGLGDNGEALSYLGRACEERYGWVVYLNTDPLWDGLRSEASFENLLRRIGLIS